MSKNNNDNLKSNNHFNNYASGIKFKYKNENKLRRKEFFPGNEYSAEIELEEKPELNNKHKNEIEFKPSTKQTIDQNKYKTFKKRYNIEEIDENEEKDEDEQIEENNSKKNNETPPSKIRNSIYTEKINKNIKNKIISDDDDEEEIEIKQIEYNMNNSLDNHKNKFSKDINSEYDYKLSKGIKSEGGDFEHKLKFKKNKNKIKWNEIEYQKIKSESKNYIPFKEYDLNKYLLTSSQINNIKDIPDLYNKYISFVSLKKKQDKIQKEILIKNILKGLKSIYKFKSFYKEFKVNALFKKQDLTKFEYKSNERTAYFDLFICFISMYVNGYEDFVESTSIKNIDKLIIPLHALAFIFSSQVFFCDIAKLIHSYYDKFLSYKIIPIYIKEDEEYRKKINTRKTIWKQFESPYFYYKNEKNLYNEDNIINEKKVKIYSQKIGENIKSVYNNFAKNIIEQHKNLNEFDRNDKKITLFNKNISAPSSLYNQISKDELFKLKLNLYKYKIREFKIKKRKMINDSKYYKNDFNNIVKNKVFKQSVFYMNPIDVVQDFLNDND